jgi:hypothetical protein
MPISERAYNGAHGVLYRILRQCVSHYASVICRYLRRLCRGRGAYPCERHRRNGRIPEKAAVWIFFIVPSALARALLICVRTEQ